MTSSNLYRKILIKDLNLYYGSNQSLFNVSIDVYKNRVTAFIGPSGCGKSSLLRCLNRMNDTIDNCKIEGQIIIEGKNIYDNNVDVVFLRKRVGMVFQKPVPFPMSIYDNVAYGIKLHGLHTSKRHLDEMVAENLERAGLLSEVKDRLHENAMGLSGGQQQRLCIARSIAIDPEVLLMDEPCSALDPIATAKVEELIINLKSKYTIVIVTHSMLQAARVSDFTAFFHMGKLIEYGQTKEIFTNPKEKLTQDYITGKIG